MTTTSAGTPAPAQKIRKSRRKSTWLTRGDRFWLIVLGGVPAVVVVGLIWIPALVTVGLSMTNWDGFAPLSDSKFVGLENYRQVTTNYPPFWPALQHNLIWLFVTFAIPTVLGMFIAVLLDRELRFTRVYQSAFFLPVVLSLALVGFMWQLIYSRDQGLLNAMLGLHGDRAIDWYGDSKVNLWAVLVAASWRHTGYIMLLYLAGLKAVDPSLREAAAMDGASQTRTFFSVVFPVMRPINIIVLVVTVIESLRAFDLVYVINKGRNGLEVIGALVFSNIVGEGQRIPFGSALATIMLLISLVFIVIYMVAIMREEKR
ncbi:carbohydrate ABC transporter permease [Angustibacter luteus]|uniref:Carbohydrate ABC transporter permease n=1 Tax=Angustibacter luteus TaxID=658456 RepID=A0ABW1JFU9_9ACTN